MLPRLDEDAVGEEGARERDRGRLDDEEHVLHDGVDRQLWRAAGHGVSRRGCVWLHSGRSWVLGLQEPSFRSFAHPWTVGVAEACASLHLKAVARSAVRARARAVRARARACAGYSEMS